MAAPLTPTLIDTDFRNWLKGTLAVLFARQGLIEFVENEITEHKEDLLNNVWKVTGIPAGTTCNCCTTANILFCPTKGVCNKRQKCNVHDPANPSLMPNRQCPGGLCTALRDAILNDHRFHAPSWKNTDARGWCSDAYQIAKCYMPPDGYSDKASMAETDFNGVISIIINNVRFEKKMSTNFNNKSNICKEARNAGREIRHSANHQLSQKNLMSYIDVFIQQLLLSDPVFLAANAKAMEAVDKLKQLKTNTLTIPADDITSVLNDNIKATFDDQQKALISKIGEHFKALKADSVDAIDKKIQEFVNLTSSNLAHEKSVLKTQIKKGKAELDVQITKRTQELKASENTELKATSEKEKTELKANSEMEKAELKAHGKKEKAGLKTYVEKKKAELKTHSEKEKAGLQTYSKNKQSELLTYSEKYKSEVKSYSEKEKVEPKANSEKEKAGLKTYSEKEKNKLKTLSGKEQVELKAHSEKEKAELKAFSGKKKAELKAFSEQEKVELKAHSEKEKVELKAHSEKEKVELKAHGEKEKVELKAHSEKEKAELKTLGGKEKVELKTQIELYSRTVDKAKIKVIEELEEKPQLGKQELDAHGKHDLEAINGSEKLLSETDEDTLVEEFKKELVRFYKEKESMIPASPLVEDHAVPLMKLYVQPPISAFTKPNAFGQGKKRLEKTSVTSYREMFIKDDNVAYKNIYVEANAGYGKTSFTQKIAMTWCLAQNPKKSKVPKNQKDDVDSLKRFELLFLLHLRDFQGDGMCLLEDLILKFVTNNLPGKEQFSKQFIVGMLQTKACLVIIDGLDEWVHPGTCTITPGIPHNNYRKNCTIITTTRPWKLSTIGLAPNLIDRHLEISTLDDITSEKLKTNAVKLLSKNMGEREPDLKDFDRKVSSVQLGDIRLIPYILLQLICIWFDGLSIGKSKCETYSNTIELTLERGLKKKNVPTLLLGNPERNVTVPDCMRHNVLCNQYVNLLLKLGHLAFYTLFQEIKESSLVIESITVLKFLTQQELDFCLKIGLLSQTKDSSKVSVKRFNVFFQHKFVHEFMAALYITSEWNNENIKLTIIKFCSNLRRTLEMENLFIFVCGMNQEVYTCFSGELQKIVDLDDGTRQYRTELFNRPSGFLLNSYQSMQVQCLEESVRNGNERCAIHLHDILLYYKINNSTILKTIINCNRCNVKSLMIRSTKSEFIQSLDPGVFTSLETLDVICSNLGDVWLADILAESAHTLKYLRLSCYFGTLREIPNVTALKGLKCLQLLYLDNVHTNHSNLKCLLAFIGQSTTLTQLKLDNMLCADHYPQCRDCDVTLNLQGLNKLERVELHKLHMSASAWRKLLFSFDDSLPHPITVELNGCQGPSHAGWKEIVGLINSMSRLSVQNELIDKDCYAWLTLKNKDV